MSDKLMTRREYAASLGLAKAGARGRLSDDAKRAIEKAIAEGMRFSDVNVVESKQTGQIKIAAKAPQNEVADIPEYLRPIITEVYEMVDGKRVHRGMAEVCRTCNTSLVFCACGSPVIVSRDGNPSGVRVYFGDLAYGDMRFKKV